jgi:hypothetical protein
MDAWRVPTGRERCCSSSRGRSSSRRRTEHISLKLERRFEEYPLVLEVRHASWNAPTALDLLAGLGVGFCNIDQPLIGRALRASAETTSPAGYVRLHGRNYKNWFTENQRVNDRYDYLYTPKELERWVKRIKQVSRHTEDTYVVTNNYNLGRPLSTPLSWRFPVPPAGCDAAAPSFPLSGAEATRSEFGVSRNRYSGIDLQQASRRKRYGR